MEIALIIKIALVSISLIGGIGSYYFFKQEDNPVEEVAEVIIEQQAGIDIDLSPNSPEEEHNGNTK